MWVRLVCGEFRQNILIILQTQKNCAQTKTKWGVLT